MSNSENKQLVIIGAGPGGYAAAFRAADLGLAVTLIDPEPNPGGVCLYRGCIPSKALLHLMKVKREALAAADWGLQFSEPEIDPEQIRKWKEKIVKKLTRGLGQLAQGRKIDYLRGKASFRSDRELAMALHEGEERRISFEKAIIATGSVPVELPDVSFDGEKIISSKEALEFGDIPNKLLVIGGGYIGLELGSVYAALGSEVTVAEMTDGYLPGVDRDLVEVFARSSEGLFEEVHFDTRASQASVKGDEVIVTFTKKEESWEKLYCKVLLAVGRKPNTGALNLGEAGVETDENGFIKVDAQRKTNNDHIYAVGDVTGEPLLAHKAHQEGRIAAEAAAGEKGAAYDPKTVPAVVFTHPEIAWCGLTETQAEAEEREVRVAKFPWSASGRALTMGKSRGLTKLVIDPDSGRILGGGAAGPQAGALIPEITLAVEMAATAEDLSLTIHPHPTLSETIMEAAEVFLGSPTHLRKQ